MTIKLQHQQKIKVNHKKTQNSTLLLNSLCLLLTLYTEKFSVITQSKIYTQISKPYPNTP